MFDLPKDPKEKARALRALAVIDKYVKLHAGQRQVSKALFNSPAELVYVNCGRKWGKSHSACIFCWLCAILRPGAEIYYLAPLVKHAKELVWANRRMQTCATESQDFVEEIEAAMGGPIKVLGTEGRLVFPNGSFIKIDGSDNIDSQLGLKPDFIVADEYRTFKPDWLEFMRPNMLVKHGKILFVTTPPLGPNHAYETELECYRGMKAGDPRYFQINMPTLSNDFIEWLPKFVKDEKQRLESQGRIKEFMREYMAQYVSDSEHSVIPQISRHTREKEDRAVGSLGSNCEMLIAVNSDDSTAFGAVFAIRDRDTNDLYIVDELKVTDSARASLGVVLPELLEIRDRVEKKYGITTAPVWVTNRNLPWLARDLDMVYNTFVTESSPELRKPDTNISVIKDLANMNKLHILPNIDHMVVECEKWMRDPKTGKIPNRAKVPLLIDCLRYIVTEVDYNLTFLVEDIEKDPNEDIFTEWKERREQMTNEVLDHINGPDPLI